MLQRMNLKSIDDYLKKNRSRVSLICFLLFSILGFAKLVLNSDNTPTRLKAPEALETYIPYGFTLVPIEVLNLQQLQSMIDDTAIVDLFTANSPHPVTQAVRLVRSPMDPNVFGVLIKDENAAQLLAKGHEFLVVIKNRQKVKTPPAKKMKRQIYFEEKS